MHLKIHYLVRVSNMWYTLLCVLKLMPIYCIVKILKCVCACVNCYIAHRVWRTYEFCEQVIIFCKVNIRRKVFFLFYSVTFNDGKMILSKIDDLLGSPVAKHWFLWGTWNFWTHNCFLCIWKLWRVQMDNLPGATPSPLRNLRNSRWPTMASDDRVHHFSDCYANLFLIFQIIKIIYM